MTRKMSSNSGDERGSLMMSARKVADSMLSAIYNKALSVTELW